MGCHAQYLSGELAEGGGFATQQQAEHWVVRTLHVVRSFYQYYSLLFSSPFAVLLNCSQPNPQALPFLSDSPPHPSGEGEGVRKQLHGSLLPIEAEPQQAMMWILGSSTFFYGKKQVKSQMR